MSDVRTRVLDRCAREVRGINERHAQAMSAFRTLGLTPVGMADAEREAEPWEALRRIIEAHECDDRDWSRDVPQECTGCPVAIAAVTLLPKEPADV